MATNLDHLYHLWRASGNDAAYGNLLSATLRVARYYTRDEDAAADVLIKILEYLPRFEHRKPDAYTNWIKVTSKRTRLDRHRFKKVREYSPTIYSVSEQEIVTKDREYPDLSGLSPLHRSVARYLLQGYTLGEAAQLIGVKAPALRKRLQRERNHVTKV